MIQNNVKYNELIITCEIKTNNAVIRSNDSPATCRSALGGYSRDWTSGPAILQALLFDSEDISHVHQNYLLYPILLH